MLKINNVKELGEMLRLRRRSLKLSQGDVAKDCDIVYQTVLSAEKGREVSVRNFVKMCDRLNLRIVLTPVERRQDDFEY